MFFKKIFMSKHEKANEEGCKNHKLEQYNEAIKCFDEALSLNPQYLEAFYNRGLAKAKLGDHKGAIEDFDNAIDLSPKGSYLLRRELYSNRGHSKGKLGDDREAVEDHKQALGLLWKYLRECNNIKEDYDLSNEVLNVQMSEAFYDCAALICQLDDFKGALQILEEAISFNPKNAKALYYLGVLNLMDNDYEKSIQNYNDAIYINPEEFSYFNNRGLAKAKLGDYEEAIKDYDKAISLSPKNAKIFYNRGLTKVKLGNHKEASKDFDEACCLNSQNAVYFYSRGLSQASLGLHEEAIKDYDKVISLQREFAMVFGKRGDSKRMLGLYEEAIKDYDKAIRKDSHSSNFCQPWLVSKWKSNLTENGVTDYSEYSKGLSYNFADCNKAICYLLQKNTQLAEEIFKSLLESFRIQEMNDIKKPGSSVSVYSKNCARIGLHCLDWLTGKEKKLVPSFFNEVLKDLPNHRQLFLVRDLLTCFYLTAFEQQWLSASLLKQAYLSVVEELDNYIKCCPEEPTLYYYRAQLLLTQFDMEAAIDELNKALKISPKYPMAQQLLNKCQNLLNYYQKTLYTSKLEEPTLSLSNSISLSNETISQPLEIIENNRPTKTIFHYQEIDYSEITMGKELGRGGFGIVYQGRWDLNDVAIKKLNLDNISEDPLKEFKQEVDVLAQLNHPHIVHFYGASIQKDNHAIVMEYCDKGSLYTVLHNHKELLSWETRTSIALGAGKGLHYLHGQNMVHRDIKSHNILLDVNYVPKIADFGLSKTKTNSCYVTSSKWGSIEWMAPEFFTGEGLVNYSANTDIYAYGIVLWELSSRQYPYLELTWGTKDPGLIISSKIKDQQDKIPEDTPPKIAHLIQWCRKMNPEERPKPREVVEYLLKLN